MKPDEGNLLPKEENMKTEEIISPNQVVVVVTNPDRINNMIKEGWVVKLMIPMTSYVWFLMEKTP